MGLHAHSSTHQSLRYENRLCTPFARLDYFASMACKLNAFFVCHFLFLLSRNIAYCLQGKLLCINLTETKEITVLVPHNCVKFNWLINSRT